MVNNSFKENFYGKKKINVLTVFSISHKSGIKIVCCRQATKNKIYTPKNTFSGVSKDRSHREYLAYFYTTWTRMGGGVEYNKNNFKKNN